MHRRTQCLERQGSSRFVLLSRRSCIPGKTLGSYLGSYPATADCRLWLHEHGFAKLSRGPEAFAAILHTSVCPHLVS